MACSIQKYVHAIKCKQKSIQFCWVKAHIGIDGNEAADAAAKAAAEARTAYSYAKFPLSYVKHEARRETLEGWKDSYANAEQGSHTRRLCPELNDVFAAVEQCGTSFYLTQYLTGHGYHRAYLHRFKITETETCPCDDLSSQTIDHLIYQCPRFARSRFDHENICSSLRVPPFDFPKVIKKETTRESFLHLITYIFGNLKEFNK